MSKRILLLDDSEISLELGQAALLELGYEVAIAANLRTFREQLEGFQPHIILTDVVMPDVAGTELVRLLKRRFDTHDIPIVLFSSKAEDELARLAELSGADGFVSKAGGKARLGEKLGELVDAVLW